MTLPELIAALERAEDASEDLDLAITRWCFENGGVAGVTYDPDLWVLRNGGEFTSSLDFARMLVPDGWEWLVSSEGENHACVHTQPPGASSRPLYCGCDRAATPALALCIAALKART